LLSRRPTRCSAVRPSRSTVAGFAHSMLKSSMVDPTGIGRRVIAGGKQVQQPIRPRLVGRLGAAERCRLGDHSLGQDCEPDVQILGQLRPARAPAPPTHRERAGKTSRRRCPTPPTCCLPSRPDPLRACPSARLPIQAGRGMPDAPRGPGHVTTTDRLPTPRSAAERRLRAGIGPRTPCTSGDRPGSESM